MKSLLICGLLSLSVARAGVSVPKSFTGMDLGSSEAQSTTVATGEAKPTVIVFLSSKCPCSASHEAELKSLASLHRDMAFVGIHANADETVEQAKEHFKRAALPFAVIQDVNAQYADALSAVKTPHAYVISADGREILYQGGVSDAHDFSQAKHFYLREALKDLGEGRKPAQAQTRAIGCYIKRKK